MTFFLCIFKLESTSNELAQPTVAAEQLKRDILGSVHARETRFSYNNIFRWSESGGNVDTDGKTPRGGRRHQPQVRLTLTLPIIFGGVLQEIHLTI